MNTSFIMQNALRPESDDVSIFERTFRRACLRGLRGGSQGDSASARPLSVAVLLFFFPLAAKTRLNTGQIAEVQNIAKLDLPAGA